MHDKNYQLKAKKRKRRKEKDGKRFNYWFVLESTKNGQCLMQTEMYINKQHALRALHTWATDCCNPDKVSVDTSAWETEENGEST